jgi:hypothetical protein
MRLADRLAVARRRRFVGRAAELALFASAGRPRAPFALLYVHGPGGVGKTVLLGEFESSAMVDALVDEPADPNLLAPADPPWSPQPPGGRRPARPAERA